MKILARLGLALTLATLAVTAMAADYKFHLVNKTTKYTITGFQTYENDK
jgi:polyisoprenoid-binding protein YceI